MNSDVLILRHFMKYLSNYVDNSNLQNYSEHLLHITHKARSVQSKLKTIHMPDVTKIPGYGLAATHESFASFGSVLSAMLSYLEVTCYYKVDNINIR